MGAYREDAFGDAMDILADIAPTDAESTEPVYAF